MGSKPSPRRAADGRQAPHVASPWTCRVGVAESDRRASRALALVDRGGRPGRAAPVERRRSPAGIRVGGWDDGYAEDATGVRRGCRRRGRRAETRGRSRSTPPRDHRDRAGVRWKAPCRRMAACHRPVSRWTGWAGCFAVEATVRRLIRTACCGQSASASTGCGEATSRATGRACIAACPASPGTDRSTRPARSLTSGRARCSAHNPVRPGPSRVHA